MKKAFSIVELLISLFILGVLAVVMLPNFLKVYEQAAMTTFQQSLLEMNGTYDKWKGMGGQVDPDNIYFDQGAQSDKSLTLTPCVFAYLSEQGVERINPSSPLTRQMGISEEDRFIMDSHGVGGSWIISLDPGRIYPDAEVFLGSASGHVGTADMSAGSPDGFYINNDFRLYYKIGNKAYLIYFDPSVSPAFGSDLNNPVNL